MPSTGLVCLTFCHLGSSWFFPLLHLAPPFPPPEAALCSAPRYMDINELCWSCGVQQKHFSLAVNLLYGHFFCHWLLHVGAVVKSCGRCILKRAAHQGLREIGFPFDTPRLPSSTDPAAQRSVSSEFWYLTSPALPPIVTHLSCLMRALTGRLCCITAGRSALISI